MNGIYQMAQPYGTIFYVGLALSAICFIAAVVLFFVLKIPNVIGDLNGSTARKAIENIRQRNEESGEKGYSSSAVNKQRSKLTDRINPDGTITSPRPVTGSAAANTTKFNTTDLEAQAAESYTTALNEALSNETTILNTGASVGETTVLETPVEEPFAIEYELMFLHSDERIA